MTIELASERVPCYVFRTCWTKYWHLL